MSRGLVAVLLGLAALGAAMVGLAQVTGGGGAHALGEEAVVGYNQRTRTGQYGVSTNFGITVLAVRRGTQQELERDGLKVDPEDRDATPYYVDARFANKGPNAVKRTLGMSLQDSDGNLIGSTLLFGFGDEPFEPCREITEGTVRPGESYESCTLVLVPEGVDVGKVLFLSYEGPGKEPEWVYWDSD